MKSTSTLFLSLFPVYLLLIMVSSLLVIIFAGTEMAIFVIIVSVIITAISIAVYSKRRNSTEELRRQFVANVSHELRTPITSIKGFVETLLDGAMNDPKEAEHFLKIIAKQSDQLSAIIDNLLTISRLEDEHESEGIIRETSNLKKVVHNAIQVCEDKANKKSIKIESHCEDHIEAMINAPLIEQALINLIDNAIKYSPESEAIEVDARMTKQTVIIHVVDKGSGVEEQHQSRLFERFYRADKARSRALGGTGLGLSIVKHIAMLHKGKVHLESVPGEGSTFSLFLPAK